MGEGSVLVEDDLLDLTCRIKEQKAADMEDIANHAPHAIAAEAVGEAGRLIRTGITVREAGPTAQA